jgi:Zn-dependent alcohol dehydrogenase
MIVRATQGNGQMPDGTSRFKCKGQDIKHFVSTALCLETRLSAPTFSSIKLISR